MSDIFKNNLKKFLADQISISELEDITAQEATVNDAQKNDLQHIILELFNRKIIVKSVFDKLYFAVSAAEKFQNQQSLEPTRQIHREATQSPVSPKTQVAPEPKIPFQEALKRFQQRKNTQRDLEKSLKEEVSDNISAIPKYRVIIQKLGQQQLLHDSVCEKLNDCLDTLENAVSNPSVSSDESSQLHSLDDSNTPVQPNTSQTNSGKVEAQNPYDENSALDSADSNSASDNDVSLVEDSPTNNEADSILAPIIESFANRRLSYEGFEEQILQATAQLKNKESALEALKQGLVDGKFPDVVYQSLVQSLLEQYSELQNSSLVDELANTPSTDLADELADKNNETDIVAIQQDTSQHEQEHDEDLVSDEHKQEALQQEIFEPAQEQSLENDSEQEENQNTAIGASRDENAEANSEPPLSEVPALDDSDEFDIDDIIGQPDQAFIANLPAEEPTPVNDLASEADNEDLLESSALEAQEQDLQSSSDDSQSIDVSEDEMQTGSGHTPGEEQDSQDESNEQEDDDKTQIRMPPEQQKASEPGPEGATEEVVDDDKTVIQTRKPAEPVDDDKTVIKVKKPTIEDDDKTRIKVGDKTDITSTTQEYTSRTSQTSSTATSSTWNKPFEAPQEVAEICIGTVIKGRFRLTEFIGQGGMGDVYKAEDLRRVDAGDVETEVAIKVLNNEFKDHPDSLKALQREARKTQSLAHPHIVNVFDFDRDEYHVFMTMELMRGDPLNTAIKKNKKGFGLAKATKYIKELSTALDYAHRRGIVHADLKPGNIFIANGEIKVFDFGIARAASNKADENQKHDSFDAGSIGALTPSYASPEMLEGAQDADPRDDIYALGCIAYELITGKHPFLKDGKKVPSNEARDEHLKAPKIPGLKKWQAKALEECLAFKREDRPSDVGKFLDVFLQDTILVTNKQKIVRAIGATCILSLSIGGYFYYKSYKISAFEELVDNNAHEKLIAKSEDLLQQDRASQQEIFNNPKIRDKFREYLSDRAKYLAKQNQFVESDNMIALARKVYPDSAAISQVANEIVDIQNNRKIELYNQLDKLLSDKDYFAANYQQLKDVWQSIAVIAPSDERLQNTQPVFAFEALINKLIEKDQYVNAKEVSDYATDFLSEYAVFDEFVPTITRLGNDIQRLQERSLNNDRISTLVASLSPLRKDTTLYAMEPFLDNIERLSNLDPNNARLLELQTMVKPLINDQLGSLFNTYQWTQATELTQQYSSVLSKSDLIDSQDRIAEAQLAWTDTINKFKQDIRVRARQASPESAELLLPELQSIGASAEELAEMSDAIAQSWILKSRRLQESQDWSGAKTALESAQSLSASIKMVETIQSEFENLVLSQTQYTSQLDRAQTEALQAQKIKRIQGLESTISNIVDNQKISQDSLAEFTAAIDSLRIEEPNNNLIANSEKQLLNRITQGARQLSTDNVDNAISLLELGAQFFPANSDISNLTGQLLTLKQTQRQQEEETQFTGLSEKLDKVVQGSLNANSYDEISTILAEISRLKGFESKAAQLAVKAASAFVEKSKTQLKDLRFDEARDTVRYASTIDPRGTNSSDLIARIDQAEKQFELGQSELREQSRIESLRANLLSRILTMDFERAKEVRKDLEQAGGLDREFTDRVRNTFVEKYSERADRAATEQKFGEAKRWINDALQEDTTNSDLSRLYDLYNTAENIVDTRKTNPQVAEQLKQAALSKFTNSALIAGIEVLVPSPKVVVKPAPVIVQATPEKKPEIAKPISKPVPVVAQPTNVSSRPTGSSSRRPSDCIESMAGAGNVTTCRDPLVGKDKGPYLVVLPPYKGQTYAISKYEVRVGEYNMYCNTTGDCKAIGGNQLLPITNLSISKVTSFIDWLSSTTGFTYRIPTEGEWKFAATADNTKEPSIKNCKVYSGTILQYGIKIENINFQRKQTSNSWGVSNYLGNVQELITISGGYRAIGGHFEDSFSDCDINRTRSVQSSLDDRTGLRLIREL